MTRSDRERDDAPPQPAAAPRPPAGDRPEIAVLIGLAVLGALAFLLNLHGPYLWRDEAQTALIAETVMRRGLPYGTDGGNVFSQELGAEYGPNHIWRWHTWLPFYLAAGSFELLGVGTLAARLPFALFGLGTVLLLYFYVLEAVRQRPAAAIAVPRDPIGATRAGFTPGAASA